MAERYPQSTTIRVPLQAFLASDHVTPATGKTIAVTISKNGAAYANPSAGATNATEIGTGSYYVDLSTTDTGTLGPLFVKGAEATIDNIITIYDVVNAHTMGADGIPNAAANAAGGLAGVVNVSGTAQAGSTNSITLASGASAVDNLYRRQKVVLLSGTGAGQSADIIRYDGTGKIAYIGQTWGTMPDNTTTYMLLHSGSITSNVVRTGVAQSGTTSSIVLDSGASATDSTYIGNAIWIVGGTGAGQTRDCSAYTGSSKTASVTPNWATAPDSTSVFVMLPLGIQAATDYATASALAADTASIISEIDSQTGSIAAAVWNVTIEGVYNSGGILSLLAAESLGNATNLTTSPISYTGLDGVTTRIQGTISGGTRTITSLTPAL